MNAYTTRIMVSDHIREFREQAVAAHRADRARAGQRKPARHVARRGLGRLLHSA